MRSSLDPTTNRLPYKLPIDACRLSDRCLISGGGRRWQQRCQRVIISGIWRSVSFEKRFRLFITVVWWACEWLSASMDVDRHKQTTTLLRYTWIIIIRWPSSHNLDLSSMCCNTGESWWRPRTQFKFKHSFQSLGIELARHFKHRALTKSTVGSIKSVFRFIVATGALSFCWLSGSDMHLSGVDCIVLFVSPWIADSGNVMEMHQQQLCFLSYMWWVHPESTKGDHDSFCWESMWTVVRVWSWRPGHRLGYIEAERIFLKNFAWIVIRVFC